MALYRRRTITRTLTTLFVATQIAVLGNIILSQHVRAVPVTIVLTSGTTWTVPPAWDSSNNTIEAIGAGGDGADAVASTYAGGGGGGGEYRRAANVTLTPNSTVDINIASGGDGSAADGTWLKNSGGTIQIEANNGANASGTTAGAGGTGGIGGAGNFNGGSGGAGASNGTTASAGGGGGSAGPSGVGRNGGDGQASTQQGGGGGGGSNGGSSTAGATPPSGSQTGGGGGNGNSGSGGGLGGTGRNSANAQPGTDGGGGGGASNSTGSSTADGAAGGEESLWDENVGPSGGGGGGGGANGAGRSASAAGGDGGTYGGGGGGGAMSGNNISSGGTGGQGIIIITYEPAIEPSVTQADYRLYENFQAEGQKWQGCRTHNGTTTIPSGSVTRTVSLAVPISDLTQAFLLTDYSGTSGVTNASHHMSSGVITNSTTLTFTRGSTSSADAEISYSLVECYLNEFSAQRGRTAISSGASSATESISSVNTSRSMVIVTNYSDDSTPNQQTSRATGELQNSTTLLFERNGAPSVTSTIDWQVIEFASDSGVSLQTGETTLGSGAQSQAASISSVATAHTWLYCSYDATDNGLRQTAVGCDLPSATSVSVERNASSAYTNRVRWYVVEFPATGVEVQRGAYVDDGGSTDNARYDINIPLSTPVSSLTRTFVYKTNTTSGTGNAFPRNSWITTLTSVDTLQTSYWRGSSNGSGTHYWQVLEFYSPPPDVSAPIAAENTPGTLSRVDQTFRLRLLLAVDDATLGQGTQYKLQLAELSGSCAASSYADVTSGTTFAYHDLVGVENGAPLVPNANDPANGSRTVNPQTLVESNNFDNAISIIAFGEDGLWDFSLRDNGAAPSSTYCFRVVRGDGTPLDAYSFYPTITSVGTAPPEISFVDDGGVDVETPSFALTSAPVAPICQTATATLGDAENARLRVEQLAHIGNGWNVAIAPANGSIATWQDAGKSYDFNDSAGSGCSTGADGDTVAGQLTIDKSTSVVSPKSGCTMSGISVAGGVEAFSSGVTDAISLMSASSSASPLCYWDFYGTGLSQTVPPNQPPGNYTLDLTITVTSS